MKSAIINGIVLYEGEFIKNHIVIFDEKIEKVIQVDDVSFKQLEKEYNIIDACMNYVVPGFIDQHIHGFNGADTMDATDETFLCMKNSLVQNGVTTFLPTTVTYSEEKLDEVCKVVRKYTNNNVGAKIYGIHLEGPLINKDKKGAQNQDYIGDISNEFLEKNKDVLKIITVAPELNGVNQIVNRYKDSINFQMGHTNATFNEAVEGLRNGIKGATHLFNAMTPIHHRDLGVVGATLTKGCYGELICDNIHVSSEAYGFIVKNLGIDKTLLITDCVVAGGLNDGEYSLGGLKVVVKDGACRLTDGTLAGSTLTLDRALKNMYDNTKYTLEECVRMVTKNQAEYLSISNKIGEIKVGLYSDIVLMDNNFKVRQTFVNGKSVYKR